MNSHGSCAFGLAPPINYECIFAQRAPVHGDTEQITSTRCELMGILPCIEYLRYLTHRHTFDRKYLILITADNEVAIKAPKKLHHSTKTTFSADMNVILHVQNLIKPHKRVLTCKL